MMTVKQKWRMSVAEIASAPSLVPGQHWSPLDGVAAPEYVPERWDGPHVGYRLVQAFETLASIPMRGAGGALGFWPQVFPDAEDYNETWETMSESDRADLINRNNKKRPSAQDISRMEKAIAWPGAHLSDRPDIARTVQRVAFYRSMAFDNREVARKMKRDAKEIRVENREGLDIIAAGLRRSGFPVF